MAARAPLELPLSHVAGTEPVDVVFRRAAVQWKAVLKQAGFLEVTDGLELGGDHDTGGVGGPGLGRGRQTRDREEAT